MTQQTSHADFKNMISRFFLGVIGIFSATIFLLLALLFLVPIPQSVVASGHISSIRDTRSIIHDKGGTLKSINVSEEQYVETGDLLLQFNDDVLQAEREAIATELIVFTAESDSLKNQNQNFTEKKFSPLISKLAQEYGLENLLSLEVNRREHKESAEKNIQEDFARAKLALKVQVKSRQAEITARREELSLLNRVINRNKELLNDGIVSRSAIDELLIQEAALKGPLQRSEAEFAAITAKRDRIHLESNRITIEDDFERLSRLAELSRLIAERKKKLIEINGFILATTITAPVNGQVNNLNINTIGSYVRSAELITNIVPVDEPLLIEVDLAPRDSHAISRGMAAKIVFSSLPQRDMPELTAHVESISTDVTEDKKSGRLYYKARLVIPSKILKASTTQEHRKLYSGLPVDVYLVVDKAPFANYILKPLTRSFRKSFRA